MTRAYQEIYLSKAQSVIGDAFDYAVNTCGIIGTDFVKLFIANGVAFPNATSCSYQFYRNLVEDQMGIAFSTEHAGRNDRSNIRYIPIDNICAPWKMKLYWHNRPLTEDEMAFRTFAQEFYRI